MALDRSWFEREAPVVAPDLLNKLLVVERGGASCSGRICETEAYMPDDPASHTFRGRTPRNEVMFGRAGHLYVYLSYGIHHCANVVTGLEGSGQAVLIRAVDPVDGIDLMRARRSRPDHELANGPGKVCQAFGIVAADDGTDLLDAAVSIIDDGTAAPSEPRTGPRVGISRGVDTPWRFRLPTDR
jgi:DNA-3-methyladenine glycosylase